MLHQPITAPTARSGGWEWTTRRFVLAVLAIWLASIPLLLALHAHGLSVRAYPDPDDELRLVEVRDWLAGQSFWDVSQHRVNPPFGGPMHWSRIVDAPIAAFELLLRPLVGPGPAEFGAALAVPMLTLLAVVVTIAFMTRRLAGVPAALLAAALAPTVLGLTVQIQPLRVDHHGWEIACSLLALAATVAPWRRGGAIAGAAMAVALQISLEQLPLAAALGGVVAARWIVAPDATARARIVQFAVVLAGFEAALFALLHQPSAWRAVYCDAVSWPHLLALAVVAIGTAAWTRAPARSWLTRAAGFVGIALAAGIALRAVPPHCGLDPFAALGPLEKRLWLAQVGEGLPVWHAGLMMAICATGFPIVGLACAGVAARGTRGAEREAWLVYTVMLLAATAVGILVMRAGSLSNAMALAPAARAMTLAVRLVRRSGSAPVRVLGSVAAILALSPWAAAILAALLLAKPAAADKPAPSDCKTPAAYRALAALPPGYFLAPIDYGPALLLNTPHAVLATGHHRSHAAIAQELSAMTGSDAVAERIVRQRGIGYVLVCPELGEFSVYRKEAPRGFAAHLLAGRAPGWLNRVTLPGAGLMLWRVRPAQPPAGLPSSRSAGGSVPVPAQISRRAVFSPSS
ncbi:hypothetical protein [Sphingomonas sp.]|uniref:hypothetical protein n=1 Tax=Sphingomonas sp. TaxID=28214 RepID=UPI003B00D367